MYKWFKRCYFAKQSCTYIILLFGK